MTGPRVVPWLLMMGLLGSFNAPGLSPESSGALMSCTVDTSTCGCMASATISTVGFAPVGHVAVTMELDGTESSEYFPTSSHEPICVDECGRMICITTSEPWGAATCSTLSVSC